MRERFDDSMTFVGIMIGMMIGAVYMLFRLKNKGDINRKNLTQFGAGSLEQDILTSIDSAKTKAHQRMNETE